MVRRRLKLTKHFIAPFRELAEMGMSVSGIAAQLGVDHVTLFRWLEDPELSDAPHIAELRKAFAESRAKMEREMLSIIREEAKSGAVSVETRVTVSPNGDKTTTTIERKNARSAADAWRMLESRFPNEYVKRTKLEHAGEIRSGESDRPTVVMIFDDGEGEAESEEGEEG